VGILELYGGGIAGCYAALAVGSLLWPRFRMGHGQRLLAALLWPGTIAYLIIDGPNELS
jgi:hypothetical protein